MNNIKSIFGSLGYLLEIIGKTINRTTVKLFSPTKHSPNKWTVYLRLTYLGNEAKLLENQIRETINKTFGEVNLRITHSTKKPLIRIVKDLTPDSEKCNII